MQNFVRSYFSVVIFFTVNILQAQWTSVSPVSYANKLSNIYAITPTTVIADGYTLIYARSTDAGSTWTNSSKDIKRYGYSFVDAQTGYTPNAGGGLLKTTDGGVTWTQTVSTGNGDTITSVSFINSLIGWVGGETGLLKKTTDGGVTWVSQTVPTYVLASTYTITHNHQQFSRFSFIDASNGWVRAAAPGFSNFGSVFKTTDGGATWTQPFEFYAGLTVASITDLYFASATHGWARSETKVLRTTNGGTKWDSVQVKIGGVRANVGLLRIANANTVYLSGGTETGKAAIWRTTDAGSTWTAMSITSADTNAISDIDVHGTSGWATGGWTAGGFGSGYILKLTGGTTWVQEHFPAHPVKFSLGQNYPNPFNPSTTISYSIPAESFVSLKIYDAIGREVSTLVNERANAGQHDVRFDGTLLTSGVYFSVLRSGALTETKKMILSK